MYRSLGPFGLGLAVDFGITLHDIVVTVVLDAFRLYILH